MSDYREVIKLLKDEGRHAQQSIKSGYIKVDLETGEELNNKKLLPQIRGILKKIEEDGEIAILKSQANQEGELIRVCREKKYHLTEYMVFENNGDRSWSIDIHARNGKPYIYVSGKTNAQAISSAVNKLKEDEGK